MPQLLPLSRAARLVGVSRGELQRRIRRNELDTFEGMIKVSDLLRAFPEARLQDDSALERAERIKALASPRSEIEKKLPSAKVLASRLTDLSRDLTESKTELSHYADIVNELEKRFEDLLAREDASIPQGTKELFGWLR